MALQDSIPVSVPQKNLPPKIGLGNTTKNFKSQLGTVEKLTNALNFGYDGTSVNKSNFLQQSKP